MFPVPIMRWVRTDLVVAIPERTCVISFEVDRYYIVLTAIRALVPGWKNGYVKRRRCHEEI